MHAEITFTTAEPAGLTPHGALNDAEAQPSGRWAGKRRQPVPADMDPGSD